MSDIRAPRALTPKEYPDQARSPAGVQGPLRPARRDAVARVGNARYQAIGHPRVVESDDYRWARLSSVCPVEGDRGGDSL